MGRACGMYGGEDKYIQGFGGDTWRKETTWKPTYTWEDNIKYLQEVGWGGMD